MKSYSQKKMVLVHTATVARFGKKRTTTTRYVCQVEEGMYNLCDSPTEATNFKTANQAFQWMHRYGNTGFTVAVALLPTDPIWKIVEL